MSAKIAPIPITDEDTVLTSVDYPELAAFVQRTEGVEPRAERKLIAGVYHFRNTTGTCCCSCFDWLLDFGRPRETDYHITPWEAEAFIITRRQLPLRTTGWKIHISIDLVENQLAITNPNSNISRAWHIIAECCMRAGVDVMKIIKPTYADQFNTDREQKGKIVTIYASQQQHKINWLALLTEIETRITEAGIRPGQHVEHKGERDVIIGGKVSTLLSCRNDGHVSIKNPLPQRMVGTERNSHDSSSECSSEGNDVAAGAITHFG